MKRIFMAMLFCLFASYTVAGGMPDKEPITEKEKISEIVAVEETGNAFKKFIFLLLLCII